jgi:hypothetical protein
MKTKEAHRFAAAAAWIWAGLLVWATYFLALYVFAALACERGFARLQVADIGLVPFAAACGLLVALLVTAVLAAVARRHLRSARPRVTPFADFLAWALALLGALATVWTALPPLLLQTGCA